VGVVDGDTIDVYVQGQVARVRLIGIDTPETVDPRKPVQCFGTQASSKTRQLLDGQTVTLKADPTQDDTDKYGRLLRYVYLSDGTMVNQYLVAHGFAFEYTYKVPYQYQEVFQNAEANARAKNFGLWSPDTCDGKVK
jgi:micrococcal nuclease